MSNLKQLRGRLTSIESTQKITKAMQMVSASKLRQAKKALSSATDLHSISQNMIDTIVASKLASGNEDSLVDKLHVYDGSGDDILIVFTSDRGLCGSYNTALLKKLKLQMEQKPDSKLFIFGKKGYDFCKSRYGANILAHYSIAEAPSRMLEITMQLVEGFVNGSIGSCQVLFTYFKNAITQDVTNQTILPMVRSEADDESSSELQYELEGENLLYVAMELYLRSSLQYMHAQACTSEEGARTTAMDNATRNAGEMMDSLRLKLNRTRQAIITTELIEIISGAEAV